MPSGLDNLHRAFSDVMLDLEGEEALLGDPEGFAAERGLGPEDQAAFRRYGRRFATYRALVYCTLTEPLDDSFPLSRGVVGEEAWDAGLREFVASRSIQSYYYRDLQPSFVAWLAESRWGAERWPCLLQLAHYELMEMEILQAPDAPVPQGLGDEAGPASRAVFDGAARNLSYAYRVHEADEEDPEPAEGPTHLLCYRDVELSYQALELSPHSSALLARCQEGQPVGEAAAALGLDLEECLALLRDLRTRGALLGFA